MTMSARCYVQAFQTLRRRNDITTCTLRRRNREEMISSHTHCGEEIEKNLISPHTHCGEEIEKNLTSPHTHCGEEIEKK